MKPIKTQCPSVCCFFILIQKHLGFISSQALNRGRLVCCISGILSSLFCSSIFFFLSQFLKWIQKNKKSSFVSNPSNLPIACRLSSQTPAYIQTLLSDLPHNMSWSLHLQHLFVKPKAWARTRGSVQERYTGFHSQEENPHGSYPFLSALPSVGKLFERVIAPDLNIYTCFSFCYGCQAQGSDYTPACWIS